MPTAFPTIQPIVKQLVQDDAAKLVDYAEYDTAIAGVIKGRYSQDRPLVKAKDYSGTGTAYAFALPSGWIDGFSSIISIEYPTGNRPPTFLDNREVVVDFTSETTKQIILTETTPGSGLSLRARYTVQRTAEADVLATDQDAVAKLSAAVCCRMLAAIYAQTSDSTIGADVVNYRTKSQEYTTLADKYQAEYRAQIGVDKEESPSSAGGFVNWDTRQQSGYDYLWHPKARR